MGGRFGKGMRRGWQFWPRWEDIEDAYGGSSPHPLSTCKSCVSIGKLAAMISAVNSTCGAEAEAAAEEDAAAKAEAGGVHGGNICSHFLDRGSEASAV